MSRWSEWFARRTPEEASPPPRPAASAVNAVAALLAELPEPWIVLRSRRPWYSDGPPWVNFIALHPKKGIALIDAAPAQPETAVEALEEFLARTRFAAFEQGGPPMIALSIARGDNENLAQQLEIAFTHAARCRMGNGQWANAVADLLLATPELMLRRLEHTKPEAEEAFDAAEVARFTPPPPRASAPAAAAVSATATAPGSNRAERRRQQRADRKAAATAPAKPAVAAAVSGAAALNARARAETSETRETVPKQNNSVAEISSVEANRIGNDTGRVPRIDTAATGANNPAAREEPSLALWRSRPADEATDDDASEPTLTIPPLPPRNGEAGDRETPNSSENPAGKAADGSPRWLHPVVEAGDRPFSSELPPPANGSFPGQTRWLAAAGVAAIALLSIGYIRVAGIPGWSPPAAPQHNTSAPATAALTPAAPAEAAAPAGTEAPSATAAAAPDRQTPDVKDKAKTVEQAQTQPSPPASADAPQPPAVAATTPGNAVSGQGEEPAAASPAAGNTASADAAAKPAPQAADVAAARPVPTAPAPTPPTPATPSTPPAAHQSPPTKLAATGPADARLPGDTRNPNPDATQPLTSTSRNGQSAPDAGQNRNVATAAGPRPFIAPRPPRNGERPNPDASSASPSSQPPASPPPRGFASVPPAPPSFQAPPPPSRNFASNPPPLPRAEPGMPIPLGNGGGRSVADRSGNHDVPQAAASPETAGTAPPQTVTIDGLTYVDGMQPRSLGTLPASPQQGADAPNSGAPQNLTPQPVSAAPGTPYVPLTDARDGGARRAMPLPRDVIMLPNGQLVVPQAGR